MLSRMAFRMTVLASGSKGNSTVVSSSGASILVDAGLSCRETLKRMQQAGEDPGSLVAIVVSHEHSDHVGGLYHLAKKLKLPVYITVATHAAYRRGCGNSEGVHFDLERAEHFEAGRSFRIADIAVTPFTIPHDAADPVGFVFSIDGMKVAIVTDLGYMPASVREHLRGCAGLMIESNHDVEMLRGGSYPWPVKQRVMSRVGHLSNAALAEFFAHDYDGGAQFLVLAHLSEENNHPEIARQCAGQALEARRSLFDNLFENRIMLASQSQVLEPIRL